MRIVRFLRLLPAVAACLFPVHSATSASVEAYGNLPSLDLVALSPSGRLFASRQTVDGTDIVSVYDLEAGKYTHGIDISAIGARDLEFVDDGTLLIKVGGTARSRRYGGTWIHTAAFALNIDTGRLFQLLDDYDELHPAQSGVGRVVGYDAKQHTVLMPAFIGSGGRSQPPLMNLVDARLDRGRARIREKGSPHTTDWFVDANGDALLREDMDNAKDQYRIYHYANGKRRVLFEGKGEIAVNQSQD